MSASTALAEAPAAVAEAAAPPRIWSNTALWLCSAYPVVLGLLILTRLGLGIRAPLSSWLLVPIQAVALVGLCLTLWRVPLERYRWLAWGALAVATVLDLVSNAVWARMVDTSYILYGSVADIGFVLNYVFLAAVNLLLYRSRGGRLDSLQFWVDAATLALGTSVALLPFLLSPGVASHRPLTDVLTTIGYTVGLTSVAVTAALLYMHVADWREERAVAWLLLGMAIAVLGDALQAVASVRNEFLIGGLDVALSASVYSCFILAAYRESVVRVVTRTDHAPNLDAFLPVLALMVGIAIVMGAEINFVSVNTLLAAILALIVAALLVWRQYRTRREILRLNEQLSAQAAEARVSELVRSSADLIAVADRNGALSFLSPSARRLIGQDPAALVGRPAVELMGPENQAALQELVDSIEHRGRPVAETELPVVVEGVERMLLVTASDQSRNGLIEGTVLTARDLTEQRSLERELLDVATRERHRLCGDIHEGLGQQLTGVVLYLRSMAGNAKRGGQVQADDVEAVIGLVNGAIEQVRSLARGLSPLEVVHRSLGSALKVLADDVASQFRLEVRLIAEIEDRVLTDLDADHLYRIVQEALVNAARHGGGQLIEVDVRVTQALLRVVVTDDGRGFANRRTNRDGLGLRMMRYRARHLGATVKMEAGEAGGARLVIAASRRG